MLLFISDTDIGTAHSSKVVYNSIKKNKKSELKEKTTYNIGGHLVSTDVCLPSYFYDINLNVGSGMTRRMYLFIMFVPFQEKGLLRECFFSTVLIIGKLPNFDNRY